MRILDYTDPPGRPLDLVTIYLTPAEAHQLASYLEQLADDPIRSHHSHLEDIEATESFARSPSPYTRTRTWISSTRVPGG
jgi:hypothetical protein